jgi:hypothetical protein
MTAKKKKRKETYNFSFNKKLTNRGSASSFLIQKESYCEPISSHCLLNHLGVFVTRSRHKCSIGLNRLRVNWSFNKE